MSRFINRECELAALESQYAAEGASFVVIYGRRRVGKTSLIREFIGCRRNTSDFSHEDIRRRTFPSDFCK